MFKAWKLKRHRPEKAHRDTGHSITTHVQHIYVSFGHLFPKALHIHYVLFNGRSHICISHQFLHYNIPTRIGKNSLRWVFRIHSSFHMLVSYTVHFVYITTCVLLFPPIHVSYSTSIPFIYSILNLDILNVLCNLF